MFLRSLTIKGFKSFADKTTLEFTPGISVIVGPNGSGKSNISDAIAWVLGEQGPRALRGSQMADVIFAGSPSRPGLGMAEVSLVIDNQAGLIPVPASEIEISRAVFRSGESEYRLGGRPCRLLDIQELLSDTGMGRALHTIIGQGQLEDVLSARPEDRRQLVEEAAGIAKHRRRRERAERRLAGVEQDLLRLQDVVSELRRRLKPLKQQAELAERHEALSREAAALAGRLAAVRLRDLYGDRHRRRPSWEEAETRQAEARAGLAALDAEIERLDGELAEAQGSEREASDTHTEAAQAKSEAEAALRRALRLEAETRERIASAASRSGRLFALEDELERTERALSDTRSTLERREHELARAEEDFRRSELARRDAEEDRRRVESEATAVRVRGETLARTLSGHEAEHGRLAGVMDELRARSTMVAVRFEELESEVEGLDGQATSLMEEQAGLERERVELSGSVAELEVSVRGLLARQEVIDARITELSESPGAAFARRRGGRPIGVLVDLIVAPPHLELPLRAALGSLADAVVYSRAEETLSEAEAGTGGITLLATSGSPGGSGSSGVVHGAARILDHVRPDERVRDLAERVLQDAYLVQTLAEAVARHRMHPQVVFVTAGGIVVGPAFVRTAPGTGGRADDLRRESAAAERELSSLRAALRERRRRLDVVSARAGEVRLLLDETDRRITSAAEEMASRQAEAASLERERSLVEERMSALERTIGDVRRELSDGPSPPTEHAPLPPHPEPPVHLRVEVEALRRDRARLEGGVTRARNELDTLAADDPEALRSELALAEAGRARAEDSLRSGEAELERALARYRAVTEEARRAQMRLSDANRSWRERSAAADRLRQEHEQEDRARAELDRRIGEAERVLREGHDVDPAAAVDALADEDTVESLQRQSDLVARRLGLLGKVNLLATGEVASLQERHDFLIRELEDVKAARRDTMQVIREVDVQVAELFATAFRDVAREFAGLFATLFPGGEGTLTLTAPEDLLGSGIEVEARPGGKRVKRLSLLSGGERSLAALAFLFAIFRARPSPFYLMDEVEAALDDVNLSRFLEVMRGFSETSQVLVVTHQKRTMEVADILYGVSMGRDGASRVISQRLAEVAAR